MRCRTGRVPAPESRVKPHKAPRTCYRWSPARGRAFEDAQAQGSCLISEIDVSASGTRLSQGACASLRCVSEDAQDEQEYSIPAECISTFRKRYHVKEARPLCWLRSPARLCAVSVGKKVSRKSYLVNAFKCLPVEGVQTSTDSTSRRSTRQMLRRVKVQTWGWTLLLEVTGARCASALRTISLIDDGAAQKTAVDSFWVSPRSSLRTTIRLFRESFRRRHAVLTESAVPANGDYLRAIKENVSWPALPRLTASKH